MDRPRPYRRSKLSCGILVVLVLSVAENANSEIYRWIDVEGRVHYSDKKPKATADDITAEVSKPNIDESIAEQRKLQHIFRPENDADREYYRKQQAQAQPAAEDSYDCSKSRELLDILSGRVQLLDNRGKEIKFTESDRQKKVKDLQRYLEENCNP